MFEPGFPVKEAEVRLLFRELGLLGSTEADAERRRVIDDAYRFVGWFLKANTRPPGSREQ